LRAGNAAFASKLAPTGHFYQRRAQREAVLPLSSAV
jgi:hypothetical protein